jgi:hypothetical protein
METIVEPIEPRCRVCRDADMRRVVNDLLDWHGVPAMREDGSGLRRITYVDILGMLEPLNEDREERDRITYHSLRIHAKRHYEIEGILDYWTKRIPRELRKALGG